MIDLTPEITLAQIAFALMVLAFIAVVYATRGDKHELKSKSRK